MDILILTESGYLAVGVKLQELRGFIGLSKLEGWDFDLDAHILGGDLCLPRVLVARISV